MVHLLHPTRRNADGRSVSRCGKATGPLVTDPASVTCGNCRIAIAAAVPAA